MASVASGGGSLLGSLKRFDAYPKTMEDFRIKTCGGATITIISGAIMIALFVAELQFFLGVSIKEKLLMDTTRSELLDIYLDVTFQHLPCDHISVDAMDVSGGQQVDVDHDIKKRRLKADGTRINEEKVEELGNSTVALVLDPNRCESCYGAETADTKCCNTCEEVRVAYRLRGWGLESLAAFEQCKREGLAKALTDMKDEQCNVQGRLRVSKVSGNFHISPGKSFQQSHAHVHDLKLLQQFPLNLTHTINSLSFGEFVPTQTNPLDNHTFVAVELNAMRQYYVQIVPMRYQKINEEIVLSNQYSVTHHHKAIDLNKAARGEQSGLPGMFVTYDISPLMVEVIEHRRSFTHFLTGVCAIVGGVFTVAGIIDSFVYNSYRAFQKKLELGKVN